ncbi:MAG: phage major capsid protein [Clostridiales Family XIII bacterium]|jgi:HK97 family phage major capsid protein|nr:phage major capsid protein [Clostridiales Family XIII bacterium]
MAVNSAIKLSNLDGLIQEKISDNYIFDKTAETSVFQKLGEKVPLTNDGYGIPVFSGDLEPYWTSDTEKKGAKSASGQVKKINPETLAVMIPMSNKNLTVNDHGWYAQLQKKVIEAFASKFDQTVAHGSGPFGDNYLDKSANVDWGVLPDAENTKIPYYESLITAKALIQSTGTYDLNGFVFDISAETDFDNTTDAVNRPLFNDSIYGDVANPLRQGRVIGRATYLKKKLSTVEQSIGYAGDWTQFAWGQVGNIRYETSDSASVTINGQLVSAWENNLIVVRAETDFGILINDINAFAKFTRPSE